MVASAVPREAADVLLTQSPSDGARRLARETVLEDATDDCSLGVVDRSVAADRCAAVVSRLLDDVIAQTKPRHLTFHSRRDSAIHNGSYPLGLEERRVHCPFTPT